MAACSTSTFTNLFLTGSAIAALTACDGVLKGLKRTVDDIPAFSGMEEDEALFGSEEAHRIERDYAVLEPVLYG